jgi:hypothetical protein
MGLSKTSGLYELWLHGTCNSRNRVATASGKRSERSGLDCHGEGTHTFELEERLLVACFCQSLPLLIPLLGDPFYSSEEFSPGIRLQDVTLRSSAHGRPFHVSVIVLS